MLLVQLALISLLSLQVSGLFEDQAGKFDWRQKYVGRVTELGYHSTSPRLSVIVVATESHVVAGLDADNGVIRWRHVFETDEVGEVRALHTSPRKHAVSVSGSQDLFVRVWNSETGVLLVEHLVRAARVPDLVTVTENKVVTIFYDGAEMEIVSYSFDSKKISESERFVTQSPVQVGAVGGAKCLAGEGLVLVCAATKGLHTLDLKAGKAGRWNSHQLTAVQKDSLRLSGDVAEVMLEGGEVVKKLEVSSGSLSQVITGQGAVLEAGCGVTVSQPCETEGRDGQGQGYCDTFSTSVTLTTTENKVTHHLAEGRGRVMEAKAVCEDSQVVQVVLVMEDAALVSLTPGGNTMFVREEGLASLQMVQMVAMSSGDTREDFDVLKTTNLANFFDPKILIRSFLTRIKRHVSQLQGLMLAITDFRLTGENKLNSGDKFGLKKVVVGVTRQGKMYGFESRKGNLLWQKKFPGEGKSLMIQRDGRSSSEEAQAMLVYKHSRSTHFMLTFNPITGETISEQPCPLDLDQALLLPELHEGLARPVLLVGRDNTAQVVPQVALAHLAHAPQLFVMTERAGMVTGNMVTITGDTVSLVPVWNMISPGDKILSITTRRQEEVVHSAGRVLADRSVLFKYMNPNLALVMTEGLDSQSKTLITVQMVDLVTGKVHFSNTHKKVMGPFHAVHSENWAVYSYFNEKARRTELVSLEMYEGKMQSNATTFSSIESTITPLVERQAYILPMTDIVAMEETMTTKGITSKHLLVASSDGSVLDLPMHMLDPRRPSPTTPAHMREPGIPPYIPELPFPHESLLNYRKRVEAIRGIATSPSGLESTVIVLVYGLDLYSTRLAPSKGFDLIKDDFDYMMISAVILGLIGASYVTRRLAQMKMLNQAWR